MVSMQSIAFVSDRERRLRELRQFTDLELIRHGQGLRGLVANSRLVRGGRGDPPTWDEQLADAIAEWKSRRAYRRLGQLVCFCHVLGTQPITREARRWRAKGFARRVTERLRARGLRW
jgi:hypothetical protein